jgi:xanthine dehydrogenase accessory factor
VRTDLLQLAADLSRRGEPFALATVVRREAPSSAHVGDTGLVTHDGVFHGWVGGSCAQPTVVREALAALNDQQSRLIALSPAPELDRRPGVVPIAMVCHSGGSLDIFIEPMLPMPRLVVFGASPIARALVQLGKSLGYAVEAVDPEADAVMFPQADRVFTTTDELQPQSTANAAWLGAVVATMGQWDEDAARAALALKPDYLGVVASRKRYAEIRAMLSESGSAEEAINNIRNPAGLNINAQRADEIALSILAENILVRNTSGANTLKASPSPTPAPAPSEMEAIDPVCGMTVTIATARHRAELNGRTWYFCAAGCRERFLKDPARYGVPVSGAAE